MEDQVPSSTPPSRPVAGQTESVAGTNFPLPELNIKQLEALRASMQQARETVNKPGSAYIPQQAPYPVTNAPLQAQPQPPQPPQQPAQPRVVYVRRNLTVAEILVLLALSCVLVTGVQFVGGKLLEFLPRVEIKVK